MERRLLGGSLFGAMVMAAALWPSPSRATETGPSGLPKWPVINASALYMVELQSGRVLLEKNAARRLPPASLTKIMTALVALESAPLQAVVKIDERALVHRSSLKLKAGEEFLLRDLVTAMLVTSANDACEAVAWHIGSDDKQFVAMMNERAGKLGTLRHAFRESLWVRCAWPLFDGGRLGQTYATRAASTGYFHDGPDRGPRYRERERHPHSRAP